ncbi:MAG: copper amine oxidase N-terminal domain-containing protein [Candidatus Wildermuthbacteria bacterium]|nr:copper amine oxidase N-terminal domain-containing protein [Candidatus Wildermuthbacteria bacterium]
MVVDGRPLVMDVPPTIINERTLVPMRAIFEALEAKVGWDEDSGWVTATTKDKKRLILPIKSPRAAFDGRTFELDVPALIINNRTMVPLRFVGEMLGAFVEWIPDSRTVQITSSAGGIGGPNGNGNGNGKKGIIINPEPNPLTRAEATAKFLNERGFPVTFTVQDNIAFVIDASVPAEEQAMIRREMLEARRAISKLTKFPEIPIAGFFVTNKAYKIGLQCEFLGELQYDCDRTHFYGNAAKRGIFGPLPYRSPEFWLRHEYTHILQEEIGEATGSMGVGGTMWGGEGGADFLAWLSMKKTFPEFYKEFWAMNWRTLKEGLPPITDRTPEGAYTIGFFAWNYLVGEDVQLFLRFQAGPPRPLWDVWAAENNATWRRWFPEVFNISVEDFYHLFETEARPAILRGERPVWNRVAPKS